MYPSAGINAAAVAAAAAARHPVSKPFVSSILRTSFFIVRLLAFAFFFSTHTRTRFSVSLQAHASIDSCVVSFSTSKIILLTKQRSGLPYCFPLFARVSEVKPSLKA